MPAGVVTYISPTSTAPTQAQAAGAALVQADVVFGVGDTVVNIVHNMGLSALGANGRPILSRVITAAGSALNDVVLAVVDANTVSVTPVLGAANTSLTVRVNIQRGPAARVSL
jgi:hypothetical protein